MCRIIAKLFSVPQYIQSRYKNNWRYQFFRPVINHLFINAKHKHHLWTTQQTFIYLSLATA
jgi:hypothetical protein